MKIYEIFIRILENHCGIVYHPKERKRFPVHQEWVNNLKWERKFSRLRIFKCGAFVCGIVEIKTSEWIFFFLRIVFLKFSPVCRFLPQQYFFSCVLRFLSYVLSNSLHQKLFIFSYLSVCDIAEIFVLRLLKNYLRYFKLDKALSFFFLVACRLASCRSQNYRREKSLCVGFSMQEENMCWLFL